MFQYQASLYGCRLEIEYKMLEGKVVWQGMMRRRKYLKCKTGKDVER